MVYFVARVVPFVAKGSPVLLAKDGILPVAEIGILYLTIYNIFGVGFRVGRYEIGLGHAGEPLEKTDSEAIRKINLIRVC